MQEENLSTWGKTCRSKFGLETNCTYNPGARYVYPGCIGGKWGKYCYTTCKQNDSKNWCLNSLPVISTVWHIIYRTWEFSVLDDPMTSKLPFNCKFCNEKSMCFNLIPYLLRLMTFKFDIDTLLGNLFEIPASNEEYRQFLYILML